MALTSIGDLAKGLTLRRETAATKAEMQRLSVAVTTGRVGDAARHLGGNLGELAGLDASITRLQGFDAAANGVALRGEVLQSVLGQVDDLAKQSGPALLTAGQGRLGATVDRAGGQAVQALEQVVSALNTRVGDRSLLAGVATDQPALAGSDVLLARAGAAVAGAVTVQEVETALQGWLDDPAGFATEVYAGGGVAGPSPVAEGEAVALDVTATDPALRATLKGLLMGAFLAQGQFAGQPALRAALAQRAGESLIETATDRADLAARVGLAEARAADAQARNSAERTVLELARNKLVEVDGYDAATRLTEAETRLQTIYTLTARLSRLNLADYL